MRRRSHIFYSASLATAFLVLGVPLALNLVVDPFARDLIFPANLPRLYVALRAGQAGDIDERLWLMVQYRRKKSANVLIGDSRGARLGHYTGRHLVAASSADWYNFSFSGAVGRESQEALKFVLEQNPDVRGIAMLAAFEGSYAGTSPISRIEKLKPLATDALKYYSSLHVLDFSIRNLLMAVSENTNVYRVRMATYRRVKTAITALWAINAIDVLRALIRPAFASQVVNPATPAETWQLQIANMEDWVRRFSYDADKSRRLADWARQLRRDGRNFVFVDPPVHSDYYGVFDRAGYHASRLQHLQTLATGAPVIEFAFPSPPMGNRAYFHDPAHAKDAINIPAAHEVAKFVTPERMRPSGLPAPDRVDIRCPRNPTEAFQVDDYGAVVVMVGVACRVWMARADM